MSGEIFINGAWRTGRGAMLVSTNPAPGAQEFERASGSPEDAAHAGAAAPS